MPTFSFDDNLPSLPVPHLDNTLKKYLDSVYPFLTELELQQTTKIVENFRTGIGKILQFNLLERARNQRNWLEKWWLDWAYLEWREPIAPFINTSGCVIGSEVTTTLAETAKKMNLNIPAAKAAFTCFYMNMFFQELRSETLPTQKSRSACLSMDQFRKFYNTCRIPLGNKDRLVNYFRTANEGNCPTHIIVMFKNRFFKVNAYHSDLKLLNFTELYHQFKFIIENYETKSHGIGIGSLTADNRDRWAKNRQYLIDLNPRNLEYFDCIEKGLYLVNFEDLEAHNIDQMLEISLLKNPKNRYFDKSYELIVSKTGLIGSNVEHTPFDGMVSTTVIAYVSENLKKLNKDITMIESFGIERKLVEPEELEFDYDLHIENEIKNSSEQFEKTCSLLECKNVILTNCTKEKIKSYKLNPDTFAQMCMQLAYFQLHKKPAPTYETATTRTYYHGRTETVRSCTKEALKWCQAMTNSEKSTKLSNFDLLKLFREASEKHDRLMNEARNNEGCDRHLLGLMLVAKELGLETPKIFTDHAWKKSGGGGNFLISSSCIGYTNTIGTCCPFCLDGYTMIYCFSDRGLCFSITRFKNSMETTMNGIVESLKSATQQAQGLFEKNPKI